ncbi:MAG: hypothetical protein Q8P18_27580 [Pseudomonadota bacterium]|nr:hypothetical protein [Pseudomonadota bacterium]
MLHPSDPRRVLAITFDLVVRNSRAGGAQLPDLAMRVMHSWRAIQHLAIEIQPRHLVIDREVCLEGGQLTGRWLLAAFMAGLRSIGLRKSTTLADVLALGAELGRLRPTAESISQFHAWAWNESRDAFDLELTLSFTEAMEGIVGEAARIKAAETPLRNLARGLRGQMAESLSADALDAAVAELDAATVMEELDGPIDTFLHSFESRAFEVLPREFVRLSAICDDGSDWAYMEIRLMLRYPRLREAIAADRVAAQIYGRLSLEVDPRFLTLLQEVFEYDDEYVRAVQASLDASPLGGLIASSVPPNADGRAQVVAFLRRERCPRLRRDMAKGLIERGVGADPSVQSWVTGIVREVSLAVMLDALVLNALATPTLVMLAISCSEAELPDYLVAICALSDQSVLELLAALPPTFVESAIPACAERLGAILLGGRADHTNLVIARLLQVNHVACGRVLADAVLTGRLPPHEVRSLAMICGYLLRNGYGRTVLLPVARGAGYEPELRVAALAQLGTVPDLAVDATRWSWFMLFDPEPVRRRRRELVKSLREAAT